MIAVTLGLTRFVRLDNERGGFMLLDRDEVLKLMEDLADIVGQMPVDVKGGVR